MGDTAFPAMGDTPLAPPQGLRVGTSNLDGVDKGFALKLSKRKGAPIGERVLNNEYKAVLKAQVLSMHAQQPAVIVWTELNATWCGYLQAWLRETDCEMRGWSLHHDGIGVAMMFGPTIEIKDAPKTAFVYDDAMLRKETAEQDKTTWRIIFSAELSLRDGAEHPVYYLCGLHVYSGGDGLDHNAKCTLPQKKNSHTTR